MLLGIRLAVLTRHNGADLSDLLLVRFQSGAEMPQDKPRRPDGDGPQRKIEVDGAHLAKDCEGSEAVADGLPRRLDAAEECCITDDLLLALGQIRDDEVPLSVLARCPFLHPWKTGLGGAKTYRKR